MKRLGFPYTMTILRCKHFICIPASNECVDFVGSAAARSTRHKAKPDKVLSRQPHHRVRCCRAEYGGNPEVWTPPVVQDLRARGTTEIGLMLPEVLQTSCILPLTGGSRLPCFWAHGNDESCRCEATICRCQRGHNAFFLADNELSTVQRTYVVLCFVFIAFLL